MGKRIGAVGAIGLLAVLGCSGGGEPESDYRWEEETVYEDPGPSAQPRRHEHEDDEEYDHERGSDRPSNGGAASGSYGGRARRREPLGAIYSPKRGVFCDEEVQACYTAKGGHPGVTEQQFGVDAGRRLARRIDDGPKDAHGIYRIEGGGVCDRLAQVCYDREGASGRMTRAEFGHGAAQALSERGDERTGPGRRGGRIYSPREGVTCDASVAACYVDDEAHAGYTKQQFGVDASRDVEQRIRTGRDGRDGIYRPGGGIVCDRLSEVCYDKRGASERRTREEFGREAAEQLAGRME